MRRILLPCATILALLGLAAGNAAAQAGSVTGRTVDGNTRRALVGAQVFISGLRVGGLTGNDGRYLIPNVPAGTHRVQVTLIGYAAASQQVTVTAGSATALDFELRTTAISLDEIVVTGVGVREQRRQLGSSSASIGANVLQERPVMAVTDALRGQIAGVVPTAGKGETGAAAPIRIRGQVSLSQRSDPVVYIDGVRQDGSVSRAGGAAIYTSRLDDINPADIERIEVIKGAAAATLFGTEASAGVIQIFTKRGREGAPQYSFSIDQGALTIPRKTLPPNTAYDLTKKKFVIQDPIGDVARIGHLQNYNLSISGGIPSVRYFISGRYQHESGAVPASWDQNISLRTGLDMSPTEKLRTEVNLNVIRFKVRTPAGSTTIGIVGVHTLANPLSADTAARRPYGESFVAMRDALDGLSLSTIDRYTIDGKATYQWRPNITSQFVIGYNHVADEGTKTVELGQGVVANLTGTRDIEEGTRSALTVDFNTAWEGRITKQVGLRLWGGGQAFFENKLGRRMAVVDFPAAGLQTLSGGGRISALTENISQVVNAGVFSQAQLDLGGRFFLTGGLRADGNSAFGKNYGLSLYPKVSGSYVISDESFWPDGRAWSLLRLRAAYGASGLQPGAFDAQQTWVPRQRLTNNAIVWPGNVGNASLKPERSAELEMGADMSFLDDRIGVELTHFRQKTSDAIVPLPLPATLGFIDPQIVNLGQLSSRGFEGLLNWHVIRRTAWDWSLSSTVSTLDQKVVSLGLGRQTKYLLGGSGSRATQWVVEGFPAGVLAAPVVDKNNPYTLSVPIDKFNRVEQLVPNRLKSKSGADSLVFFKGPQPTFNGSVSSDVGLPGGIRVRATVAGAKGFSVSDEGTLLWNQNKVHPRISKIVAELDDPNTTTERRKELAAQYAFMSPIVFGNYISDGDYIRFQELTLSYRTPLSFAGRLGLKDLALSLSGQNLGLWTRCLCIGDPGSLRQADLTQSILITVQRFELPSARRLTLTMRGGW